MTTLADVDLERLKINIGRPDQIRTNSIDLRIGLVDGVHDYILHKGKSETIKSLEKIGQNLYDDYEFKVYTKSTMFRLGVDCHTSPTLLSYIEGRFKDAQELSIDHRSYAFDISLARSDYTTHLVVREKSSPYVSQEKLLQNYNDYLTLYKKPKWSQLLGKTDLQNFEPIKLDDIAIDDNKLLLTADVSKGLKAKKLKDMKPLRLIKGSYLKDQYWEEVGGRNGEINIERNSFYIFSTREILHLKKVCGIDHSYDSGFVGRRFGGVIDCGFIGVLNMNMYSEKDQVLYDGQPLAAIVLDELSQKPKALYGVDGSSNYQMSLGPTVAKIFI